MYAGFFCLYLPDSPAAQELPHERSEVHQFPLQLDFEDEALRVMARKSMERKTGARGLRAIMESTLMDLMYKTPSDDTIRKCIITKEAVEGTGEPQIVHGEAPAQPVNPANTGRRSQRAHKKGTPETA